MFDIDNVLLLLAAWIAAEPAHQPIARYSLIGLVVIGYLVALAAIAFLALVIIGIITRRQPPRVGYTYFAAFLAAEIVVAILIAIRFFTHLA